MKFFIVIISILVISVSLVHADNHDNLDIRFKDRSIGSITNIVIRGDAKDPSIILIDVVAEFPSFADSIDRALKDIGNFGSCSKRIFWAGGTSFLDTGNVLRLASRARYEQWYCDKIFGKSRLFRDTKTIHWVVFVKHGPLDNIEIGARLQNIKNFPNWAERWLGKVEKTTRIPIPVRCGKCACSKVLPSLKPTLRSVKFSRMQHLITTEMSFSIKGDFTKVLPCL